MCENLEAVLPRDRDQCHAGLVAGANRQSSWRGYRNNDGKPGGGRFLDHFNRNAAAQPKKTLLRFGTHARERAGKLIQRIVTADVLPEDHVLAWPTPCGGMNRTGLPV